MRIFHCCMLAVICLNLFSCKHKDSTTDMYVKANSRLTPVLDSFVKASPCSICINEIYIDKIDPHLYKLIIYQGEESLTKDENTINGHKPLAKVIASEVEFKIFSGVEHYFNNEPFNEKKQKVDSIRNNLIKQKIWIVKDSFGILTVKETNFNYPYSPFNLIDKNTKEIIISR